MKGSHSSFYWYWVIGLLAITSISWFYLEVLFTSNATQQMQIAKSRLGPLGTEFNSKAIESVRNRKAISEIDFQNAKPYTGVGTLSLSAAGPRPVEQSQVVELESSSQPEVNVAEPIETSASPSGTPAL